MRASVLLPFALACVLTAPLAAQGSDAGDGLRLGISLGGISTVALNVELFRNTHAVELDVGSWSFHEISMSIVYKEYIGGKALRPFVGAGLWTVVAAPEFDGERTGASLVLRAPLGLDWSFVDRHAVGAALNLNRGLAVRRSDPLDDLPMNGRIVPLPELYYRFTP
jgi:hypothetical protein